MGIKWNGRYAFCAVFVGMRNGTRTRRVDEHNASADDRPTIEHGRSERRKQTPSPSRRAMMAHHGLADTEAVAHELLFFSTNAPVPVTVANTTSDGKRQNDAHTLDTLFTLFRY